MENNLIEILNHIPPQSCNYQEWVNVGMALKHEGYSVSVWEDWSASDPARYHSGECQKKWESFQGSSTPVTAGTLVQMAKDRGYSPIYSGNEALDFDAVINDEMKIIDSSWVEAKELHIPSEWKPARQLITYLETLFNSDENVGYVTKSYEKPSQEGKFVPTKGCWDRTAGQLIDELMKCNDDVGAVLGDYNEKVGAWIRFNPLDGKGVKNENVTDYRYALVESDEQEIEKQNALIRELELPVACLVHSGGKSLHAIVKIDAPDYKEYRKRVDFLYAICNKNGLKIDTQNKNPSRLSRMPGVVRNGKKQYLLDTNIGKSTFEEWQEWVNGINDDLPDFESLEVYENNLPELSPPLIDGILRQGHKMLVAGPSKAGKSFALIELCICIAEGVRWLGNQCSKGKVLYVNLELDKASCIHRFFDVYKAMKLPRTNIKNIEMWNLRGMSVPMDKLAPMLIRRAEKEHFTAIIIDPIYKVITGDENSADQMANFCNQFDKICTRLGCSVIYCHHHSKGAQGDKRSMDRASGSGVFARDPDALLDLIELDITDNLRKQEENKAICDLCIEVLENSGYDSDKELSQDDKCSSSVCLKTVEKLLSGEHYRLLLNDVENVQKTVSAYTAWRIEGTLREFPKFPPLNIWFRYPVHEIDKIGSLKDLASNSFNAKNSPFKKNFSKKKTPEEQKQERMEALEKAYSACNMDDSQVTLKDLAEYMEVGEKTVRNRIKEHGGFWIDEGNVGTKN